MAQDDETERSPRSASLGMGLFLVYLALYASYMGVTVLAPGWMAATVGGINVAILYGFVLIAVALILALVYVTLLRQGRAER